MSFFKKILQSNKSDNLEHKEFEIFQQKEEFFQLLRKKYQTGIDKYGGRFFNLDQLEERIQHAQQTNLNIKLFSEGELKFYIDTQKKAEAFLEKERQTQEVDTTINKIIEDNDSKIQKYPIRSFSSKASGDMQHFVGAISEFYEKYYIKSKLFHITGANWSDYSKIWHEIERFYLPQEHNTSVMLSQYITDLKERSYETIDRIYLNTAANSLFQLKKFLENYISKYTLIDEELLFIKEVLQSCTEVLNDFRLTDLVNYKYKKNGSRYSK